MKKVKKNLIAVFLASFLVMAIFGFAKPNTAQAIALAPNLGTADSFSALSGLSASAAGAGTTISADLGLSPGLEVSKTGPWTVGGQQFFGPSSLAFTAKADALIAYDNLIAQTSDGTWSLNTAPVAGVWTAAGDPVFAGPTLTLNGGPASVWVFQLSNDFTFTGNIVLGPGVNPCNVFWAVARDATIAAGSHFVGTLIAGRTVTLVSGATVNGRILSGILTNGSLTTDGNTISGCTIGSVAPSISLGPPHKGTINVVKTVINDNGGTKTVADFPLFVNNTLVISGQTNIFHAPAPAYRITETTNSNYAQSFSGDCDSSGYVSIVPGDNKFCIITNNDIGAPIVVPPVPPLIDIIKVPTPLALPDGPGSATYNYTLKNIGTIPVTKITVVDDTCSSVNLISGDTNNDGILDTTETWKYSCQMNLATTTTNTVVATGWANGISATDIANATVVVGTPVVPPLIHVTKIPNPLTLLAGGGAVTYTEKISNPGTISLNNVKLVDNKCSPMKYISGDTNHDSKLDPTETWTYTCKTNLTKTTMNTAIASGEANGFTVRDLAVATVVVATIAPKLPNTGIDSSKNIPGIVGLSGIMVLGAILLVVFLKKYSA
jgi:LPXTG-motif cell wall-anchored protein/uncharacterized repeat protein (TIGR01451 family)